MKFKIVGRPEFFFSLTKEQIELICVLSKTHYDFESRSLSKQGGFIHGWNFRLDQKSQVDVSATWRQLDSLSKVLENTIGLTNEQKQIIGCLINAISTILITARDEICPQWEAVIDTQATDKNDDSVSEYIISTFNTGGGGWVPMNQNGVKIVHVLSGLETQHGEARTVHRNKSIAWDELQVKVNNWKHQKTGV